MSILARPAFSPRLATARPGSASAGERRADDRWPLDGLAVVHESGGRGFGRRHVLRLQDGSHGGIGATCPTPVAPGTTVAVTFNAPGRGIRPGTIVRCLPAGAGYRLAIRFDGSRAA